MFWCDDGVRVIIDKVDISWGFGVMIGRGIFCVIFLYREVWCYI